MYKKQKTLPIGPKTSKKSSFPNLKLSQVDFSKPENNMNYSSKKNFPKTTKAENNINIYSQMEHTMVSKNKNFNSKNSLRKSGVFVGNQKSAKPKNVKKELKKAKRMVNFTSNKFSKTFNKLPASYAFYANENFKY
jgi:hypothetical protein